MEKLKKSLLSIYASNIINGSLGLLSIPLGVNFLGLEGYGLIGLYWSAVSILSLSDLGLSKNLQKQLCAEGARNDSEHIFKVTVGLHCSILAALVAIAPVAVYSVPDLLIPNSSNWEKALRLILLAAGIDYSLSICVGLVQSRCISRGEITRYSKFSAISGLLKHSITIISAAVFQDPALTAIAISLRRVIEIPIAYRIMGKPCFKANHFMPFPPGGGAVIRASLGLFGAQVFQTLTVSAAPLLVTRLASIADLGLFRASWELATRIWFISNGLGLAVFPRLARITSRNGDSESAKASLLLGLRVSGLTYALICILGQGISPILLPIFGLKSNESAYLFCLIFPGMCLSAHSNLSFEFMQAAGLVRRAAILSSAALSVLILVSLLAPKDQILTGVGIGWSASQLLYSVAADASTKLYCRPGEKRVLLRSLTLDVAVAALTCIVTYSVALNVLK